MCENVDITNLGPMVRDSKGLLSNMDDVPDNIGIYLLLITYYHIIIPLYLGKCEANTGFNHRIKRHFFTSQNEKKSSGKYFSGPLKGYAYLKKKFPTEKFGLSLITFEFGRKDNIRKIEKEILERYDFITNIDNNDNTRLEDLGRIISKAKIHRAQALARRVPVKAAYTG